MQLPSAATFTIATEVVGEIDALKPTAMLRPRRTVPLPRSNGASQFINSAVRSIVDWLALDFALHVQARPEHTRETRVLAVHHRFAPTADTPDPVEQAAARQVLGGKEIVQLAEAWRNLPEDAFVRERRFEGLVGLPLLDERRVCLGALVVGRRDPLSSNPSVVDSLRVVAHRLALDLELRRVRDQGRARGLQDALTGLPNRTLLSERLGHAIIRARRGNRKVAVLFLDLDRFKHVNDSMGHAAGDRMLKAAGSRLRHVVREGDTVARLGGDEFTVVLEDVAGNLEAEHIAQKVIAAFDQPPFVAVPTRKLPSEPNRPLSVPPRLNRRLLAAPVAIDRVSVPALDATDALPFKIRLKAASTHILLLPAPSCNAITGAVWLPQALTVSCRASDTPVTLTAPVKAGAAMLIIRPSARL